MYRLSAILFNNEQEKKNSQVFSNKNVIETNFIVRAI